LSERQHLRYRRSVFGPVSLDRLYPFRFHCRRQYHDAFADLGYHMSPDGKVLATPSEEATSAALEGGRAAFLRAIDETYHETCRPDQAEAPLC
jgi:hypothetical protein